jgi:transporter family protein
MSWEILICLTVILYSISVLLQRIILKETDSNPILSSIIFQLLTGFFLTSIGLFLGKITLPPLQPLLINLFLMICFYGSSSIFLFKALKQSEASQVTIIFATRALFTILASSLLLNEGLTGKQFIGVLLIIAGIISVHLKSTKLSFGKGDLFAILAAIGFGFANTNDRFLLHHFTIYTYMSLAFIGPAILTSALYYKELKHISLFFRQSILQKMILLSFLYGISSITFFGALQLSPNSSQVAAINISSVIVIVLLSIILLKERGNIYKKIFGACLTFIGLLLLS